MDNKNRKYWNDWRWQAANSIRTCSKAEDHGIKFDGDSIKAEKLYPILLTPYYLNLMKGKNPQNSLAKQVLPDGRELRKSGFLNCDPLGEEKQMPVSSLIHRYRDRAVLIATNRCPIHCRFCFRKRIWRSGSAEKDIDDKSLKKICSYLKKHEEIKEVLVSGGDPFMLETKRLKFILDSLINSGVRILRIGTRVPAALPMRIDNKLAEMLSDYSSLWISVHFNHPDEITEDSANACGILIKNGIPLLSQTVLLSDVNDDAEILEKLFRELVMIKVKPYYLFHGDPVCGTSHFRTGIKSGLEIIEKLGTGLSFLGTPSFAIDLPRGGGKVHLMPNYKTNKGYRGINRKTIFYPE